MIKLIVKRNLHFLLVLITAGSFALVLGSCDAQGAQDDFVTEAGLPPSGITRILDSDFGGDLCSEDEDDWRIAPIYNGIIVIDRGATPNPASSRLVTIELRILLQDRVRGSLTLRALGGGNSFIFLDTIIDTGSLDFIRCNLTLRFYRKTDYTACLSLTALAIWFLMVI